MSVARNSHMINQPEANGAPISPPPSPPSPLVLRFTGTVEPRLTTTLFLRPPRYYGHILPNQT